MNAAPKLSEDGYAADLERATRGLLAVNVVALGRMQGSVNPVQLRALQTLDALGGGNVTQLAAALHTAPSTASRLSDRLTAAGLISRRVSPSNRRATLLELTAAGRHVLDELARVRTAALAEVASYLSEAERTALLLGAHAFSAAHDHLDGG